MTVSRQSKDKTISLLFFVVGFISIVVLFMILVFLCTESIPIFRKVSVVRFLFGRDWYPTSSPPDFGIFPLLVASLAVTITSALISIPLGVMTAIYLAEIASARIRAFVKPLVELLAALPSVVIGFFRDGCGRAVPAGFFRCGHRAQPPERGP